jgi:hypothetical protein
MSGVILFSGVLNTDQSGITRVHQMIVYKYGS